MILSLENKNKNNFILYSTHIFVSLCLMTMTQLHILLQN